MTFEEWRTEARTLIAQNIEPRFAHFKASDDLSLELFPKKEAPPITASSISRVPAEFIERARVVYAFRADDTPLLLYRILWRLIKEEPHLLKISFDPDTKEFDSRYRLVKRDIHKMTAFVRFRELENRFIAWHRPDHKIVRLAASFFVERFNGMNWSILTTDECIHWDQNELTFTDGLPRSAAPSEDNIEALWVTYYGSIFNPARIKWNAMTKEMPIRHWKTLPETAAIQDLLRHSPERLQKFYREQNPTAEKWIPESSLENPLNLERIKDALPSCHACGICERSNGPVMGEGPKHAQIMFIGEQPGEEEDQKGRPFLGPAGQLLNEALHLIGLERDALYITNAVKAFKWTDQEGQGRIHRGSSPAEIAACNPWLKRELEIVKPKKIVCLGRSAAQAILGKSVLMREVRGQFFKTPYSEQTLIVPHPAFILRIQDEAEKQKEFNRFVDELALITHGRLAKVHRLPEARSQT